MSFDINTARTAVQAGSVKIQKGEGITHALMRVADAGNTSKGVKDLEKAFRALTTENKKAIMDLAKVVGENVPFAGRTKNKKYNITDIAKIDEKLTTNTTINTAPVAVPPPVTAQVQPQTIPATTVSVPSTSSSAPTQVITPLTPVLPVVPASAPVVGVDFSRENQSIKVVIENAQKYSVISTMNKGGSFYFGTSGDDIQYAVIRQSDGEFYIFDQPVYDKRTVYRSDANKNVIGVLIVDKNNAQTIIKGQAFSAVYMPKPTP